MTADSAIRERPILMSAPMVRAILEGRKSETRRVKHEPDHHGSPPACPYGAVRDRLWVRETWAADLCYNDRKPSEIPVGRHIYLGGSLVTGWHKRRSPIHMPRWASRITLEITGVRVERLQEISEDDAQAEGVVRHVGFTSFIDEYRKTWDSLNAKRGYGWEKNPWVWVLNFKRIPDDR